MRRRKFAPEQQLTTSPATPATSSSAWDFRRSKRWPVSTRTICENRKSPSVSRSCCFGASLGSSADQPTIAPTRGAQHSSRRRQRQSRRRPQREPLITRPAAATTPLFASCENNCRLCSRQHHRTRPPRRDVHQPPRLSHPVCCRGRILKFTCRTSAPTSILLA